MMSGFFNKPTDTISSLARDASCSRGWLRLIVQVIFFAITVASFLLILGLTMRQMRSFRHPSRCDVLKCNVHCSDAPYYDKFMDDVITALLETEAQCSRVSLLLHYPLFNNNTLPAIWFSDILYKVFKLTIIGGNLRYLPANGFMGPASVNIRVIILENITIDTWEANSLVGLSNLQEIHITKTKINNVQIDALRAVDDTLETLTIEKSGEWRPDHLTGMSDLIKLKTVVFTQNNFSNVLNKDSFSSLKYCEILFLNSCEITAITAGTFDNLININVLYLNDNHLMTIPPGLFDGLKGQVDPISRINLLNNPWLCDCSINDFRVLSSENMLLVEPSCYYPTQVRGVLFSEFEELYCSNCSDVEVIFIEEVQKKTTLSLKNDYPSDDNCLVRRETPRNYSQKFISPVGNYKCDVDFEIITTLSSVPKKFYSEKYPEHNWLQPTFLMKSDKYYLIEIDLLDSDTVGLLWYEASCPNEVYCVSILPDYLKIYNYNLSSWYVFCPWELKSGSIEVDRCIIYDLARMFEFKKEFKSFWISNILYYCSVGIASLLIGACLVYVAILINPTLLKGSKRLLFVKHKEVEALVLPPKVPLRSAMSESNVLHGNIFLLPSSGTIIPQHFNRSVSMRSNDSNSPSYISVIKPSEDQLTKWRAQDIVNNESASMSEISSLSNILRRNSLPYFSLDDDSVPLNKS